MWHLIGDWYRLSLFPAWEVRPRWDEVKTRWQFELYNTARCTSTPLPESELHPAWGPHPALDRAARLVEQAEGVSLDDLLATKRDAIRRGLVADLWKAMRRLNEPLAPGETPNQRAAEVTTGSDTKSGVYREDYGWIAWAFDPADMDGTETVTVGASDLPAGQG